eukprot:5176773-Amphidinium_carterae.2
MVVGVVVTFGVVVVDDGSAMIVVAVTMDVIKRVIYSQQRLKRVGNITLVQSTCSTSKNASNDSGAAVLERLQSFSVVLRQTRRNAKASHAQRDGRTCHAHTRTQNCDS